MNIKKILKPVLSIVLALVLGAAVIAMVGENPLSVYRSMLLGAFGKEIQHPCLNPVPQQIRFFLFAQRRRHGI